MLKLLAEHGRLLSLRGGRPLKLVRRERALARPEARLRPLDGLRWYDDPVALAAAPDIDVFVELIGGSDGAGPGRWSRRRCAPASRSSPPTRRCSPSTARSWPRWPRSSGVPLAFEAAVTGGIPTIKTLREGLVGNRVRRLSGILNGTCNYILTEMRETGRDFADVLAEAQRLGYAEADPTIDVDGIDAAHKLADPGRRWPSAAPAELRRRRRSRASAASPRWTSSFAEDLGYRIKLLGLGARRRRTASSSACIPAWCRSTAPLAQVDGVLNAVFVEGDCVGRIIFQGRGAGAGPTASAVVADIVDVARGRAHAGLRRAGGALTPSRRSSPMDRHVGRLLHAPDGAGPARRDRRGRPRRWPRSASRSKLCCTRPVADRASVPVVLTTHATAEARMQRALARIATLTAVAEEPRLIRIEPF